MKITGDPIIDSGLLAIKTITNKENCTEEELKKVADDLVDLYLTPGWTKELCLIFPNATYIQNAKNYDKSGKSKEFLYSLIHDKGGNKTCVYCGASTGKKFNKSQIPLVGSGNLVNFFLDPFSSGLDVCSQCAFAVQFAPLMFYKIGGKPVCISTNYEIMQMFAEEFIAFHNKNKILGTNSGLYNDGFKHVQNAIFHLAYKTIKYRRISAVGGEITLYRLDNFNQGGAGVEIYKLPNNVFKFVVMVMTSADYKKDWYALLSRHYTDLKSKDDTPVWKANYNKIHDFLLKDKSIVWAFKDDKNKKSLMPWPVIEKYLELVRNMNKQRIEVIKNLADRIAMCIEESGNKGRVNDIIMAKDFVSFKNQIRLIVSDWQKLGKEDTLVTFDNYVIAVADDNNWKEVQNLVVIRLYEKLHNKLNGG